MRSLAEYVMKGRTQAVMIAVMGTGTVFFAWLSAAVIALVMLRKGLSQGGYVLFWALLPALALIWWGDTGPLTTLLGTALVATVLRTTVSWSFTLAAACMSGVLTGAALLLMGSGYLEQILQMLSEMLTQMQTQLAEEGRESAITLPTATQVAGLFGLSNAMTVVVCLVLARWWQAMLYNPGGFRAEFHSLRLTPSMTVALLVLGLVFTALGPDYRFWALIFAVPFMFAGFALVHAFAASKGLGGNWLGLFYVAWLLADPVKAALLLAAVTDSWMNFRERLAKGES